MIESWLPTKRPSREFMYRRVRRFLAGRHFSTALDLACGVMRMARYIDADEYIGLDINDEALQRGVRGGSRRRAVVSTIEDMPAGLTGDFVLCLETIGINKFARVDLTMVHLERMIAATRPGGSLILNVGHLSRDYFGSVEDALRRAFRSVEVIDYGRHHAKAIFPVFLFRIWRMEARPEEAASATEPTKLFIAEGRLGSGTLQ